MHVDEFLARLEGLRKSGPDRWMALCPGHADRNPSLSVRVLPDGVILVRCHAGCEMAHVVGAMGLCASDLFPTPPAKVNVRRSRPALPLADVLAGLAHEVAVASIASCDLRTFGRLESADHERLLLACMRINCAIETLYGH